MKNLILCSILSLWACAASTKAVRDTGRPVAGEWKGVPVKGDTRTMTDGRSPGREPGVISLGSELTPIAPEEVSRDAR
jgi:hypothetical protein